MRNQWKKISLSKKHKWSSPILIAISPKSVGHNDQSVSKIHFPPSTNIVASDTYGEDPFKAILYNYKKITHPLTSGNLEMFFNIGAY